ncbi:MAG: hypothetical protein AB1333_03010 [Patescibacteria group bacterium]
MDINKYKDAFAGGGTGPNPEYDHSELLAMGYKYNGHFNRTNPRFKEYIEDLEKEGYLTKTIELNEKENPDNKNVVDIWIKKETSFKKIA